MTSGSFWAFTPELLNEKRGTAWSMKEQENRHYGWMRADNSIHETNGSRDVSFACFAYELRKGNIR